jgi:hypothetical protein
MALTPLGGVIGGGITGIVAPAGVTGMGILVLGLGVLAAAVVIGAWRGRS